VERPVTGAPEANLTEVRMPETRHELSVGESLIIDDCVVTVTEIRGDEVLFQIERIPGLQSLRPESADHGIWNPAVEPMNSLAADPDLVDPVPEDSRNGAIRESQRRFRPR